MCARSKDCGISFRRALSSSLCIRITFHSVIDLYTGKHKSVLKSQAMVWVNWRKSTLFWLMENICFIMFGCGFVSFISPSTVSAYLARAWHPLRDEVFSFGKWFLQSKSLSRNYSLSLSTATITSNGKKQWNFFFLHFIVPLGTNSRNQILVFSTDHSI